MGKADLLVFTGSSARAARAEARRAGLLDDQVASFEKISEAADFLRSELREGDLVLLKAGRSTEHLARIYYAQTGTVECWRPSCKKPMLCDFCDELGHRPDSVGHP
jgi:UDP-N-acetylmuramoyl-tripeptide--D-alanyl-D-alanine ligase